MHTGLDATNQVGTGVQKLKTAIFSVGASFIKMISDQKNITMTDFWGF
jgi:hypothetical protein